MKFENFLIYTYILWDWVQKWVWKVRTGTWTQADSSNCFDDLERDFFFYL